MTYYHSSISDTISRLYQHMSWRQDIPGYTSPYSNGQYSYDEDLRSVLVFASNQLLNPVTSTRDFGPAFGEDVI